MAINNFLLVAAGGAIGAAGRYALTFLPIKAAFPFVTLLTNVLGAFLIGFAAGLLMSGRLSDTVGLFLKTGVCGGFTTFSTFSAETVGLIERGDNLAAIIYAAASVGLCVGTFCIGRFTAKAFI